MSNNKQIIKRDRTKRKAWTRNEAQGFLHFYKARKAEFNNARKKRKAYSNVLNDMIAAGITGPKTTVSHLEVKMTTLQRSYKSFRNDPNADTALSPCMLLMQEIFGDDHNISDNSINSFNLGVSTIQTEPLSDDYGDTQDLERWDSFSADDRIKIDPDEVSAETSPYVYIKSENSEDTTATAIMSDTFSPIANQSKFQHPPDNPPKTLQTSEFQNRTSRMNRAQYFEKKLQLKAKAEKNKAERWEQFKAIEERKIELLQKLLECFKK